MSLIADSIEQGSEGLQGTCMQLLPAQLRALIAVLPQLSRYTLVSAAALALDFGLYLALTSIPLKAAVAGVLGYAAGTVLHYLLSVRFVFNASATNKAHARLFGEFAVTGLSGMAATAIVIAAATDLAGLPVLPAKVLAAGASFLLVFLLRRAVVFVKAAVHADVAGR